jgi:NAD(P)-dependent dehydrogenase (short-subunit alcohol dehydrogenase family)
VESYAGKTIVLTGASEGIGRALALELAPERPRLVLAARDPARLEAIAAATRALGAEALAVPTDVADRAACERLIERAVAAFGRLDVLIANAGITMWTRFAEVRDLDLFERLMSVNYLGSVYPTYYALPLLRATRGQIVAVSSVAGLTGVPTRTGYAATKHAQFGFFDSLRIELAGTGVDVTMIAPDFVRSEIHARALGADGRALGTNPLENQPIQTAEEAARRIVRAMRRRKRLAVLSRRGRLGRFVRPFLPGLIDRIARRAIERAG